MILFNGELSMNCKDYILKREMKVALMSIVLTAVVVSIPILVATFLWDWKIIIGLFPLIMLVAFCFKRPSQKDCELILPNKITIEDDTIISEGARFNYACPISEVRKVVDMGEWYHIFFNYRYRNPRFVCQKDLIREGSIDEFEKLFENKIIKQSEK